MLRRDFLASLAAAARPSSGYRAIAGAQVYVWTQHFARQKKPLAEGLDQIFADTAAAGYRFVEVTNAFVEPPLKARTLELLERHRLKLPVVYRGGRMHTPDGEQTIASILSLADELKPLGIEAIDHNPDPKPNRERKTDAELEMQIGHINRLAGELHKRGLRLFIHQHAPEMAENAREWRHILHHGDPNRVEFSLDVHWVYRGGQDPLTIVREAGKRIGILHLRNSRGGVWLEEFADGDVDYAAVARQLQNTGFRGYVFVELAYDNETAITRPLGDSLRRSRAYAEQIFRAKA